MKRAAIYARFSSDLQRDRSIEDQVELCRAYCARNNLSITALYDDRARSGASVINRDGLMRLMDAARDRQFDVLVVEALDRLSRDQEDLAGIYKRLSFLGIDVMAVHDGRADVVQVGIRGLVGALYLQDLAHKVRRGMAGVIRDGRNAGGLAYGYKPVLGKPGELEIEPDEAATVRRVFEEYAAGRSPRDIAGGLNRDRVPPPRGSAWAANTLNGSRQRGNGILNNPLYRGERIWNRVRMVKDPDTGKRVSRLNPEGEWQTSPAPELRIVSDELYEAVRARRDDRGGTRGPQARRSKYLLSGLLKCGCCGAGLTVADKKHHQIRLVCARWKESRSCDNRRRYYKDRIEAAVLEGLRDKLADRRAIDLYIRTYNDERKRLASDAVKRRAQLERRFADAQRELDRSIDLAIKGVLGEREAAERLPELRAARDRAQAELAGADEPPKLISLHPAALRDYLRSIDRLEATIMAGREHGEESTAALRDLIEAISVSPAPDGANGAQIEIRGHLTALIGGDAFPTSRIMGGVLMVAEARFSHSPPRFLLPFRIIRAA